jgi:hypothetical protein
MANKMRFLYFNTGADDAVCVPVDKINQISHDGDASVHVDFLDSGAAGGVAGSIEMTVTDGYEAIVVKRIATICSEGTEAVTVIADETNSQYCHSKITAVGAITAA